MNHAIIEAASAARRNAYAPYSEYSVGAALLDSHDNLWTGCNVENISYGISLCAERNAIGRMVSEGFREIRSIAVVTKDGGTPCGMCLQAILEFSRDPFQVEVLTMSEAGDIKLYRLSQLIPHGFTSEQLKRT